MNFETIEYLLDKHYKSINKIILARQDPITGLLPASTSVNAHGDYTDAWVRDNVYSILSVWGLSLSYRKYNPDHHRTYLLSQSVVKLMRGLLTAMMRQASHVEKFKNSLNPMNALHAKYGTNTGLPVVGDGEWGHLQLDATSLYLLMIAQMTASGLKLIYTMDEVNFIQNLVHYISRTYCTPDFGIWERGNKINHGTPEINASSVGMAKAALEAMNGFNLFGNVSSQEAVIHVVPSDIARSRFTLHGLLPRESNSKETDAALLSIIGYPAYAIEDKVLLEKTRKKIIKKLSGNYGCKRFLLDGHQTAIEDDSRLHYEPQELRAFEHIESEWPLFFTYLLLDAHMREDSDAIQLWRDKLEHTFVNQDGEKLLPELYMVKQESIEAEKQNSGSQTRIPNENIPLVWAQSLYMLSDMIQDEILRPSDIDPLHRCERIGHQRNTQILIPILAENNSVKQKLLDLGFESQTLENVSPIKVLHAHELSKIHTIIGKNEKLSLTGRPMLVTRTITSSRLHMLADQEMIFLPYYFNPKGFYFSYDNKLLVNQFRSSLKFLSRHWDLPGQPIMPFLVREDMILGQDKDVVLKLLHDFQTGICGDIMVRIGALRQLLNTAAVERIDNIHNLTLNELQKRNHTLCNNLEKNAVIQSLSAQQLQEMDEKDDDTLVHWLVEEKNRLTIAHILSRLWNRHGGDFKIQKNGEYHKISEIAEHSYEEAMICSNWAAVRHLAEITSKFDERLEDALLDIVIVQKRLAIGRAYSEKATFSQPLESTAIVATISEFCGHNSAENVLTQEIILHLGHLIRSEPKLFTNLLTLRTWYFVQLLVGHISREFDIPMSDAYEHLLGLAPHDIYDRLKTTLQSFGGEVVSMQNQENLSIIGLQNIEKLDVPTNEHENTDVEDWAQWRLDTGMIARLSPNFYKDIWYLLQQCEGLVIGDKYNIKNRIGKEATLAVTAGERDFALKIDSLLHSIEATDYRQLNIEALECLTRLFHNNSQISIKNDLVLDVLIGHAVRIAWGKNHSLDNYDEERGQAWEAFYRYSLKESDLAFLDAFIYLTQEN